MVINELLLDIFRHSSERIVDPLMITGQVLDIDNDHGITVSVGSPGGWWRPGSPAVSTAALSCWG